MVQLIDEREYTTPFHVFFFGRRSFCHVSKQLLKRKIKQIGAGDGITRHEYRKARAQRKDSKAESFTSVFEFVPNTLEFVVEYRISLATHS